jgi:plasmid rolling circle replication initiator protein Rep
MSNITFSEETGKHNKKVQRLSAHKRRVIGMSDWIDDIGFQNPKFDRLRNCHSWMMFRDYFTTGKIKLSATNSCNNHLLCPLCAIRRAGRALKTYYGKYEECLRQNPKLRIYYVVLTIKNGHNLEERYNHLQKCVRKLITLRSDALKAKKGNKKNAYALDSSLADVAAGAYSFEIKRGENSGQWHPHVNLLILTDQKLNYKKFHQDWRAITGDSTNLNIELKENGDKKAFAEIFKYAMKFSEMEFQDTFTAWETLLGKRLFGCFGDFWGLKVSEDSEITDDMPFIELFYTYQGGKYRKSTQNAVAGLKTAYKSSDFRVKVGLDYS